MARWRKNRAATKPLNEIHQALGEFLTAMGRVEFRMLLFMNIVNEAPLEALFAEYSSKQFSQKINVFKKWVDFGGVLDTQKVALRKLYSDLEALRVKRNFIVHGETWEGAFGGGRSKAYRVGLVKGNLDYLDDFENAEHGENVFDVQQVREATSLATYIENEVAAMRREIEATAIPHHEAIEDMSKWPAPKC